MQSTRTNQAILDKENIQSFNNFKNLRQANKKIFGKELINQNKQLLNNINLLSEKQIKPETFLKPVNEPPRANPQFAEPFQASILEYLKSRQSLYYFDKDYMDKQSDINKRMRAILIDWLVDVNLKFKLLPQTLFMTVNLIDRYLSIRQISRSELQLVGIAALMIVGKYEEIYPPVLKDYIAVCDNAYKREDILKMEENIIIALEFNLTQPSTYYFLQLIQQKLKLEAKPLVFAQYILETVMLDMEVLKFNNLTLVAGAIFLVNKIFKRGSWNHEYTLMCGVSEQEAKACAKELFVIMQQVDGFGLAAIKRKFSDPKYFQVSRYKIEKVSGSRH